ncbi:hypothetical protein PI124_g7421 [Phytophthora idaei]|nr:hypothetical protein PI125_g10921 [Phytophthora idaei]KAG3144811.1 hypothetical protein PI126_g13997 [Phytophthora idaei]KAG3247890.1 hypothetical protein PI124_g7421 [Phytophthora idaei]
MRATKVILLVAVSIFLGTTGAATTSGQIMKTSGVGDNGVSAKRFLRMQGTSEYDEEERGRFKDVIDKAVGKAKRLATYNKWIFSDKTPEWVALNRPDFAKRYKKFWENRLVRGGKYN